MKFGTHPNPTISTILNSKLTKTRKNDKIKGAEMNQKKENNPDSDRENDGWEGDNWEDDEWDPAWDPDDNEKEQ